MYVNSCLTLPSAVAIHLRCSPSSRPSKSLVGPLWICVCRLLSCGQDKKPSLGLAVSHNFESGSHRARARTFPLFLNYFWEKKYQTGFSKCAFEFSTFFFSNQTKRNRIFFSFFSQFMPPSSSATFP